MIGLLFELIEWSIKLTVLFFLWMIWAAILMFWGAGALICLLTKQPRPAYPYRALSDLSRSMRRVL